MEILNINNTKVVYHYLPSRLTNIQILTNIGSSNEKKEEYGYAHIIEHCMFKGSKKYPGPLDLQTTANNFGGKLNAWTSYDNTVYHITMLNEFFEKGFELLADLYQNPLFPENEVIKELNPILSEMRRHEDNAEDYLNNRLIPAFIGEEAGHPIIGNEDNVSSATVDKIHTFHKKYYGGNNMMISIVGGIYYNIVEKVISQLFTPSIVLNEPKIPAVNYKDGELKLYKAGIQEGVYLLCYPALNRFHPNRYKQGLMIYTLGGNDSGMLHERIREQLGLSCYGIFASQFHFDSHNIIEISTGIAPEQIEQCHEEVLNQIKKISTELIDETRLARAKASLRTNIAAASENSSGFNNAISIPILKGMKENPLEKLLQNIESTTVNDIMEIAQETFAISPFRGTLLPE